MQLSRHSHDLQQSERSPTSSSSTDPTSPPRAARPRACGSSTRRCARTGRNTPTPWSPWSSTPPSATASTRRRSAEFDDGIANNELVAPPAGAIGRGDAFVLSIANKVGARVLSNDSFQEFHGDYPWLFDEGRLIGGKPVPHIGWVFVERLPVKGPISRKAQRAARRPAEPQASRRSASKEASQPMPVPTAPPPGRRRTAKAKATAPAPTPAASPAVSPTSGSTVNDVLPFLDFVEHHPLGSSVNGVVESYSSHGAYVTVGDVRGYVPLRLMGNPPPRSAREVMKVGDAVTLVVTNFAPARRSVDMAMPDIAPEAELVAEPELDVLAEAVDGARRSRRSRSAKKAAAAKQAAAKKAAAKKAAPSRRRRRRRRRRRDQRPPQPRRRRAGEEGGGDRRRRRRRAGEEGAGREPAAKKQAPRSKVSGQADTVDPKDAGEEAVSTGGGR